MGKEGLGSPATLAQLVSQMTEAHALPIAGLVGSPQTRIYTAEKRVM